MFKSFAYVLFVLFFVLTGSLTVLTQSSLDDEIRKTKLRLVELNRLKIQQLEAEIRQFSKDVGSVSLESSENSISKSPIPTFAISNQPEPAIVGQKPEAGSISPAFLKNPLASVGNLSNNRILPVESLSKSGVGEQQVAEQLVKKPDDPPPATNSPVDYVANAYVQAYAGTEILGATSAESQARPYFQLRYNQKLGTFKACPRRFRDIAEVDGKVTVCEQRNFPLSLWTDMRFASTPSQALPNFSAMSANSLSSFFGSNQSASVNAFFRSFQVQLGLELGVGHNLSIIGGAGATSALSSAKSVQAYKIPRLADGSVLPAFREIFGQSVNYTGLENLILTSAERDRFLRNWFFGGRLRFNPYNDASVHPVEFELTVGQDEVITKKLIGGILKFNGHVPLPIPGNYFYFGASLSTRLTRKVKETTTPFFLEPNANYNLFANNNLIRSISETPFETANRDNYSFRLGIDIVKAWRTARGKE